MKIFEKVFSGALYGLGIGYLSTIIVSLMVNDGIYYPSTLPTTNVPLNTIIFNSILMSLMGLVGVVSSDIYKLEKFSLLTRTVIQFFIIVTCVIGLGIFQGWIKRPLDALSTLILASAIFLVIWVVMYFVTKSEIEKINKALSDR